jgi:hypothetical protein
MGSIEVVIVEDEVRDDVKLDVRVGKLEKLLELVRLCVEEGDGLAEIDMVYDPDGVRLEDIEAVLEEEGLILRLEESDDDAVKLIVAVREFVEEAEEDADNDDVFVTVGENEEVEVIETVIEVLGDDDNV